METNVNLKTIAMTATFALCTSTFAFAQGDTFSAKDKLFLKEMAQSDMAEMKLAQLALQKSQSDDVKQYAQQMMDDHTKLMQQEQPVQQKAGITPPTDVNPKQKAQYTRLQALSGTAFDKAYAKGNVKDHTEVLTKAKAEDAATSNSDIKTLIAGATPVVTDHQQKAQSLDQKLGGQ